MQISHQTYDALINIAYEDMSETEFHVVFDIYLALTNDDLSPKDPAHDKLVSHLAGVLQI
mgnify:CR=1 FL=1